MRHGRLCNVHEGSIDLTPSTIETKRAATMMGWVRMNMLPVVALFVLGVLFWLVYSVGNNPVWTTQAIVTQ